MSIVVRPYETKDLEGYFRVRQYVYNGGEPIEPEGQVFREDCFPHVGERNGEVVAGCVAYDFHVTRGDGTLRCAAVAAVGVLPEHRASGAGSTLMRGVLPLYCEQGFDIAALYPFRGIFYRKFGYEFGGKLIEITCPTERFPHVEPTLPTKLLPPGEFGAVKPCYEAFARRLSGVNIRNADQWWRKMGRDKPHAVYAVGNPVEAYVALRLVAGFWENQEVGEIVWTTPAGYQSALALLRSLAINQLAMKWYEPSDSPFLALYDDQGIAVQYDWPRIMWRAVHVPNALKALRPRDSGEATLRILDPLLPENEGPWRLRFGTDGVEVERGDRAEVEMDIRAFSQALMGEPSFDSLLRMGRASVSSGQAAEAMRRLLPSQTVYCLDFF